MPVLAKYGYSRCHFCGKPATHYNHYDTHGSWIGVNDKLTVVPLCNKHAYGQNRPKGVKGSWVGGGNPSNVKEAIERMFGPEKKRQLTLI